MSGLVRRIWRRSSCSMCVALCSHAAGCSVGARNTLLRTTSCFLPIVSSATPPRLQKQSWDQRSINCNYFENLELLGGFKMGRYSYSYRKHSEGGWDTGIPVLVCGRPLDPPFCLRLIFSYSMRLHFWEVTEAGPCH